MEDRWKDNPYVVNLEEKRLLAAARVLYSKSVEKFYKESKYDNFIDNETFEKHKVAICSLSYERQKLENFIKNKFKEDGKT